MSQIYKNSSGGGGGSDVLTLSDDVNAKVSPDSSGNIQLQGHVNQQTGKFSTVLKDGTNTHEIDINPMSSARWIVDPLGFNGTHTTIGAALTSSFAGDTIFLMPGTYTENNTISKNVHLVSYNANGRYGGTNENNVIIVGKFTISASDIIFSISGCCLTTNADNVLSVSGSGCEVQLTDCFISVASAVTAISVTGGSTTGVTLNDCTGSCTTSGVLFANSNSVIQMMDCDFQDDTSPGTSTNASGNIYLNNCILNHPLSTSGSGVYQIAYCQFGPHLVAFINTTWLTLAGTGTTYVEHSEFYSGTASAISIGSGTTLNLSNCVINSSNTDTITGTGTLDIGVTTFTAGSTDLLNPTLTINYLPTIPPAGNPVYNPAFILALKSTTRTDVTGDGTSYDVVFDTVVADQGGNTSSFTTFTVPVTGLYLLNLTLEMSGITSAQTQGNFTFWLNGTTSITTIDIGNVGATQTSGFLSPNITAIALLTTGETVQARATVYGTGKIVSIDNSSDLSSSFSGYLIQAT